jgi:hypothetical protein
MSVDILFLDSQILGESGSLEQIFEIFVNLGFKFEELKVEDRVFHPDEVIHAMSQILTLAYETQDISFTAFDPELPLEIFQQLAWGQQQMGKEHRAYVRTSTDHAASFWRREYNNLQYCSRFLTIATKLYEVLHPTFGWVDLYHGWTTTHEDIEAMQLRYLYWANFFGPRLVEKIGRERIQTAPAWRVEQLDDGGLLYLLAPHLGSTDEHVSTELVKERFGVEHVR